MRIFTFLSLAFAVALAPAVAEASPLETLDMQTDAFFQILDNRAIDYFSDRGILASSGDGTLHLSTNITRAEFVEAVVNYAYPRWALTDKCLRELDTDRFPGVSYTHLFNDVRKDATYALHLCAAMRGGMVWGYGNGDFQPDRNINFAEAAKVMNVAFNLDYQMPMYQTEDWYQTYLRSLHRYTTFPNTIRDPSHSMRVGEVREMLVNISKRSASYHGSRADGRLQPVLVSSTRVQQISTNSAQDIMMNYSPHTSSRYRSLPARVQYNKQWFE